MPSSSAPKLSPLVTNEVLELVNKQKLDFKSVTPEAEKAPEAAAPKAETPKDDKAAKAKK